MQPVGGHPGIARLVGDEQQVHGVRRERDEPGLDADPEIHRLVGQGRGARRGEPPDAVAGIRGLKRGAEEQLPHARANAVGADDEIVACRPAVRERDRDAVVRLRQRFDGEAKGDIVAPAGLGRACQDAMQGRARQHVGRGLLAGSTMRQEVQRGEVMLRGVEIAVFVDRKAGIEARLQARPGNAARAAHCPAG